MKHLLKPALAAGMFLSALACSKSSAPSTPPTPANTVRLSNNATFGEVLTDSAGNTLYFFSPDVSGQTTCTGGCLAAWPAFYTPKVTADNGLADSDFSVITRPGGAPQTTYKGWPLYYFAQDTKAGDINGDDVESVWFVAKPDYTIMVAVGALKGADSLYYDTTYHSGSATDVAYITDPYGRTLYNFAKDSANENKYTKSDFSNNPTWPIYQLSAFGHVPSLLAASDCSLTTVFTETQGSYRGWPMYYFVEDAMTRGNTFGVSIGYAGLWPVARPWQAPAP